MKVLKAVLAGCGGMSRAWLKPAREIAGLEIAGLVDVIEDAARARAKEFGLSGAVIGDNLKEVIDKAGPDVVFDVTVPEAHHSVVMTALSAGCHVLGEKPMADTMEHAREMVAAARKAGRIHAVIQNRRYDPNIRRFRRFLASGALGRIGTLNCDFYIGAHFGGFRDRMRHVLLVDMAIHTIDAARYLMGADPGKVVALEWNPPGSWYDHDASAAAVFTMADGTVFCYRGSWCAEGLNTTWECDWRVQCSKGSAVWDGGGGMRAEVVGKAEGFTSEMAGVDIPPADPADRTGGHRGLLEEFIACVRDGGKPETSGDDNIKSLAMVLGAVESSEKAKWVDITWDQGGQP
jgi:predicted dehydrogenase